MQRRINFFTAQHPVPYIVFGPEPIPSRKLQIHLQMDQLLIATLADKPQLLRDALTKVMRERPDAFSDLFDDVACKRARIEEEPQQGSGTALSTGVSLPTIVNCTPDEHDNARSAYFCIFPLYDTINNCFFPQADKAVPSTSWTFLLTSTLMGKRMSCRWSLYWHLTLQ